ncbi:hypothetical protein HZH68_003449 [Vespula germanica]|uniref:Uncharacterized protein n=1 Tax=Vespula germanica TaxID=30212 RepID=A0A834U317_VESGE|nr:hypothetical protein HZH68_003449 [Vespula germanica]
MEEVKGRRGEGGCQRHRDVGGGTDGARHASGDVGGALRGEKRRSLEMSLHEYIDIPLEVSLSLLFPGSTRVSARLFKEWAGSQDRADERFSRSLVCYRRREDETRPMLPRWLGLVKWRCSGAFEFCPRIDNDNDEDDDEDDDDIGGLTGST